MTLFKQMFLGVSVLFFLLLTGVEAIYLSSARTQIQNQFASHAQDAATSIALRLGNMRTLEDRALVEALVNPTFDRGYFQEISVLSVSGEPLVRKVFEPAQGDVPEWFTRLFPLRVPGSQSLVSSGWRELGRVVVVSHPNFAYQQLWQTGWQTVAWLSLVYALAILAVWGFLKMLLRPLSEIERTAVAIGARDFRTIASTPSARELARVVHAMNSMSGKIRRVVEEESARAEALRREAFVDPVTSLYNRSGFRLELQALVQSTKDVFSSALAIIEIQDFGDFNRRVGYRRGDEALALLGGKFAAACEGQAAVCGRLGGASFALAAINIGDGELKSLLAAICDRIGAVLAEQGIDIYLYCCCGATWREGAIPEFSAMLASADMALERARKAGKNEFAIEMFDAAPVEGAQIWRARIERAIDSDQIALFVQDVFGLPGRMPVHTEVTVRMTSEQGDSIFAAQFVPMAARFGLIPRLDCRVVERLLEHLAKRSAPLPMMALNISARTIADPDAIHRIFGLLKARRDLASRLTFEMTEFGASRDVALTQRFCTEVRRLGARFAMDNFGMQKDSLILVHTLKPDYIKLSPGYSREIADNASCRFFVASVVKIGQTLDIGIFAQAVEDESLIPLLAEMGLAGYQGFVGMRPALIAPP